ncbi:hypothetical protein CsatA_008950 [Cannabis sativa]
MNFPKLPLQHNSFPSFSKSTLYSSTTPLQESPESPLLQPSKLHHRHRLYHKHRHYVSTILMKIESIPFS